MPKPEETPTPKRRYAVRLPISLDFRLGPDAPWKTIGRNQCSRLAKFFWERYPEWSWWGDMFVALPTPAVSPRFGDLRKKWMIPFEDRDVPKANGAGFISQYRLVEGVEFRITPTPQASQEGEA